MKKETCEKVNQFRMCPYVTAQQLMSGKWAILIMHTLIDGPKRFNQIQKEIDITQATLDCLPEPSILRFRFGWSMS